MLDELILKNQVVLFYLINLWGLLLLCMIRLLSKRIKELKELDNSNKKLNEE